jgi:hypothetical protein
MRTIRKVQDTPEGILLSQRKIDNVIVFLACALNGE